MEGVRLAVRSPGDACYAREGCVNRAPSAQEFLQIRASVPMQERVYRVASEPQGGTSNQCEVMFAG